MINRLLGIVAPHHCYGCQKTGTLLCDNCKYNITSEPFSACLVCLAPSISNLCQSCRSQLPFDRSWCVGFREDTLRSLLSALKFSNTKDVAMTFGELLSTTLPYDLPFETVIVPVPTVASHIRERGYDHALLIARAVARLRGMQLQCILTRQTKDRQRGATKKERRRHAAHAFRATRPVSPTVPYLIVDDVYTTGATMEFAAKTLRQAGAQTVWIAPILRQPLDD